MSKFDGEQWVKEVKCDLTLDRNAYEKSPCIFSASTALMMECKDAYVPQIVSIGPYHFGNDKLGGMETFKSEATRREVVRIGDTPDIFNLVVEKFTNMEGKIRCCYDKEIPYNSEVPGWMMARDACFILEFFRNYVFPSSLPKLHPIFGPESENPGVKSEIMKDLIKLGNQIPLFILEDVLAMEMTDNPDGAKDKLDELLRTMFEKIYYRPFEFCAKGKSRKRNHILDIYHHSCLGVVASENEKENENEVNLNVYCPCFAGSDGGQCSCFGRERRRSNLPPSADGGSSEIDKDSKQRKEWWLKIPSAVQLKNGGVKFQAEGKNVDDIRFEGKTLTLVPLKLDVDSEIYIRNLIALEICSPDYKHKRMTAYARFMYELCQTDKGVDVMREKGVIIGNLWHSKRVTRLLSVSNLTISQPACQSIKETREKLSSCYATQRSIVYRSLWNEFWKAYGSKPWLVVGGFGATIVLFLTAIQVFCLFKSCGA